ncbi:MAG: PAS domain S-box protein, partial [Acidobacteria bacterium]|nr:PAS domain S-box protein [Acidobacteriota bacterium]
ATPPPPPPPRAASQSANLDEIFRTLCASAPVGIFWTDARVHCVYANPKWSQMSGRSVEASLGLGWLDAIHPEDRPAFEAAWRGKSASASASSSERRLLTSDGEIRWVRVHVQAVFSASGDVQGRVGIVEDITAHKQADDELRLHRERLQLAVSAAGLGCWDWDMQNNVMVWSPEMERIYGISTAGRQLSNDDWIERLHIEERANIERMLAESTRSRGRFDLRFRIVRPDGEIRFVRSLGKTLFDGAGAPTRMIGINLDVTAEVEAERRLAESEERFRRLYEANVVGIATGEGDFLTDANDAFLSMIGYSRKELRAGAINWRDLTPPEYQQADAAVCEAALATGNVPAYEKEYIRRDGTRVPILVGGALLNRGARKWIAFALDLRERKALEKKLLEKQKLESIGRLAAGIAHDFNNLLVGVIGNASLALKAVPPADPLAGRLEEILKAGERAAYLIRQIVAYSGRGRLFLEPVDLSALARETLSLAGRSFPPGVEIRLELSEQLPPVEADFGQVEQMMLSLLVNAAEAIQGAGVVTIRTGARAVDAASLHEIPAVSEFLPGDYCFFEVQDTGCGMTPEIKAKIFDPFFSTKFLGRGLGLAAAGGIVRGHQGVISVVSEPGAGSTFLVLLPASRKRPAVKAETSSGGPAEPRRQSQG